jgi:hypothetical protein
MTRLVIALAALAACNSSAAGGDDTNPPGDGAVTGNGTVFQPEVTDVVVEIDYETGQQPFTGPILGMGDTFDLSQANVDRLFAGKKQLTLPRDIADMQDVGTIADEELTVPEILDLAKAHRDQHDTATTKTFYVLFVSGHFADGNGVQTGVLGVSIGTTGVIAMFKDVIRSTNVPALPHVVRYVEQSTLVHELAHGFGLVNNGVPMVMAHSDPAHGAHCNNDKCVMYYLNEGASDAAMFVRDKVISGSSILFDDHCLADADAITGGPN